MCLFDPQYFCECQYVYKTTRIEWIKAYKPREVNVICYIWIVVVVTAPISVISLVLVQWSVTWELSKVLDQHPPDARHILLALLPGLSIGVSFWQCILLFSNAMCGSLEIVIKYGRSSLHKHFDTDQPANQLTVCCLPSVVRSLECNQHGF